MTTVIVPNFLHDLIHAAIDKALDDRPCDTESREVLYSQLLGHYNEHGEIPDFSLNSTKDDTK